MTDNADGSIRIGTAEREAANAALGDHLAAGRLDIDEYGDRSARAALARTRSELVELFADLPQPHPAFLTREPALSGIADAADNTATAGSAWQPPRRRMRVGPPLAARVGMALPLLALVMVLAFHVWFLFLLIPLSGMLFGRPRRYQYARAAGRPYRRYGGCHSGWY